MDADFAKTFFPLVGGVLALAGGVFTFVSGRLRDATGPDAKARVLTITTSWIATALWLIGCVLTAIRGLQIYAPLFYVVSFGLHWKLFLERPRQPSRLESSVFAIFCALTAFSVLASLTFYPIDKLLTQIDKLLTQEGEILTITKHNIDDIHRNRELIERNSDLHRPARK